MASRSHDLGELRMHYFTVDCDTFSNEDKVAAIVSVTSAEIKCSEAMLVLSFCREEDALLSSTLSKKSQYWFNFSTDETLKHLK